MQSIKDVDFLRNKIYAEIRRQGLRSNHVWKFQQYYGVFAANFDQPERNEFKEVMRSLCIEGILEPISDGTVYHYRLTSKGENVIWSIT